MGKYQYGKLRAFGGHGEFFIHAQQTVGVVFCLLLPERSR
jgi:hypothetical protein